MNSLARRTLNILRFKHKNSLTRTGGDTVVKTGIFFLGFAWLLGATSFWNLAVLYIFYLWAKG